MKEVDELIKRICEKRQTENNPVMVLAIARLIEVYESSFWIRLREHKKHPKSVQLLGCSTLRSPLYFMIRLASCGKADFLFPV